jgi:hypothetical protein
VPGHLGHRGYLRFAVPILALVAEPIAAYGANAGELLNDGDVGRHGWAKYG